MPQVSGQQPLTELTLAQFSTFVKDLGVLPGTHGHKKLVADHQLKPLVKEAVAVIFTAANVHCPVSTPRAVSYGTALPARWASLLLMTRSSHGIETPTRQVMAPTRLS